MLEPEIINRIRHIFLHPRPHVSIFSATVLLGWTRHEMTEAIKSGEVELMSTPLGKWFWREELMAKALEIWPREGIEEALGAEADSVLPHAVRLAELRARIPRYQLAMLEYFAEQDRTSVSDVLTRELEGVASEHAEELSTVVPGFAAALAWPDGEGRNSHADGEARAQARFHMYLGRIKAVSLFSKAFAKLWIRSAVTSSFAYAIVTAVLRRPRKSRLVGT